MEASPGNYKPVNEKQRMFMESKHKFLLMSGSVGAGKSLNGCMKGLILNTIYPGNHGLICRKELSSLKASTLRTFLEKVIPEDMIVHFDKQNMVLTHKTIVPGLHSKITFGGLDKGAGQLYNTKIGSTEYGWIFVDEIVEIDENDFQMLSTRLRHKIPWKCFNKMQKIMKWKKLDYQSFNKQMVRQLFGATNPDGPEHYLYKFFYLDKNPNRLLIETSTYDNPTLPKEYVETLEQTLHGTTRDRLLHGKWVVAEGIIYDSFDPQLHVIDIDMVKEWRNYSFFFGGADKNFPLPRAAVVCALHGDEIHVIDEYYESGSHAEDLGQWLSELGQHLQNNIEVYHDPSAPEDIEKINAFKYVTCEKAENAVIPGISEVHKLFALGKLKINSKCVNLVKYLQMYKWKKGNGTTDTEAPVKKDDHIVDGLRYAVFTYMVQRGASTSQVGSSEFVGGFM